MVRADSGGSSVCVRRFVCALMNLLKCFVGKLCFPTSLNRAYYFLINKNNELSFVLWQQQQQRCWWFFGVTSMYVCLQTIWFHLENFLNVLFLPCLFRFAFCFKPRELHYYHRCRRQRFYYFVQSVFRRGYSKSNAFIIIYSFYIWLHKMPTTMTHIIVRNLKYESYDNK